MSQSHRGAFVADPAAASTLAERYRAVRGLSERLIAPLSAEDCVVQSMPDASPAKWHLAHTTWYFETFVLEPRPGYQPVDPAYRVLYNSYYNAVGPQHPRPQRGLITRPSLDEVLAYRERVDARLAPLLEREDALDDAARALVELGLHHEQQHQELLLMDVKHLLSCNPLAPAYDEHLPAPAPGEAQTLRWLEHDGGRCAIGHDGAGFAFDNERPRHEVLLTPFAIADRLVTNGEWLEFIADGGYREPTLWLSDGWATAQRAGWQHPFYWRQQDGAWFEFTLGGLRPLDPASPVVHVSFYEADAFARWAGARLPTEAEWERAASGAPLDGNLLESGHLHPLPAPAGEGLRQLVGDCWEWTASPYVGYPGYRPPAGAVGEYNGKFMANQWVLRGGCCVTPASHVRLTYRNFYYPHTHWHFSGVRLARDLR